MLQKNSQNMRLQENHGLQNSPWGGGKPYLASSLLVCSKTVVQYACKSGVLQIHDNFSRRL